MTGEPPDQPPEEQHPNRRWIWIGILIALLLAGGGVAAYLLTRPAKKVVPNVVGQNLNDARTILQNDGFGVQVLNVSNPKPAGTVIRQDPAGRRESRRRLDRER